LSEAGLTGPIQRGDVYNHSRARTVVVCASTSNLQRGDSELKVACEHDPPDPPVFGVEDS
jgi:hypothetical protein